MIASIVEENDLLVQISYSSVITFIFNKPRFNVEKVTTYGENGV